MMIDRSSEHRGSLFLTDKRLGQVRCEWAMVVLCRVRPHLRSGVHVIWRNVTTVSDGVSISSSEYEIGLGIILGG